MNDPENVGEGIGLLAKLTIRLYNYERLTGHAPTRIKLSVNQYGTALHGSASPPHIQQH